MRMNPDAAVADLAAVFNKAQLAKLIHEEADAGSRGADHLRQGLLRDSGNILFRLAWLAKLRHQQQDARQTFSSAESTAVDHLRSIDR